jgi:hypothetical protein
LRDSFRCELEEVEKELAEEKLDPIVDSYRVSHDPLFKRHYLEIAIEHRRLLDRKADLESTLEMLEKKIHFTRVVNTESMQEGSIDVEMKVHENLTDVVGDDVSSTTAGSSQQPSTGQRNLLSIDDFFSRPISIYTTSISLATPLTLQLSVWDIYSKSASVRAKFRNYGWFRGDLCLRIAIAGTPFHYGKALISYQPYASQNDNITNHKTNLSWEANWRPLLLNYLSQAPGAVSIDFRGNRPVDLRCPFISPKGAHRLFNTSGAALASASSYEDFLDAGDLFIYSINNPDAVSADATAISLHIYAWMENVELGPPTATQIVVATESGDERKIGPVQKFSSAAATVSSALSVIPEIGFLAKASSMFFSGLSGISSWFGWSRPGVMDEPKFVKNRPYANMCTTIGFETVDKLALDPLQELTVDPRVCGVTDDEMSLAFLCSVPSYLTTFTWAVTDTILTPAIWRSKVTPELDTAVVSHTFLHHQPTAMSFAAVPFRFWRGKIKFRLEIVCSQFHRGKIAIGWEPNLNQAALFDTQYFLNKNYTKVIDIQETQDIEFCVNYASPYVWLTMQNNPNWNYGGSFDTNNPSSNNGFIYIVPFTELQAPMTKSVFVNVYVSGEDMQFNRYDPLWLPQYRRVFTNSARESVDPEIGYTCLELNEAVSNAKGTSDYCFGEQPLSFRALLKRYCNYQTSINATNGVAHNVALSTRPIIPSASPAYSTTAARDSNPILLRSILYAYLGIKGGMRRKIRWKVIGEVQNYTDAVKIQLRSAETAAVADPVGFTAGTVSVRGTGIGHNIYLPHTNAGVEFELPYYSNNLFHFSFNSTGYGSTAGDEMNHDWMKNFDISIDTTQTTGSMSYFEDIATAEDFNLMRYNGAPFYSTG